MISEGQFSAQVNEIERLLAQRDLLRERNPLPDYSGCGMSRFRGKSYRETWETCFREQWYDFLLTDNALLQFRANFDLPCLNYVYYESPRQGPTYEDFLVSECGFNPEALPAIGDTFRQEYETSLVTAGWKEGFAPFRYDYNPDQYVPGRHPASHIHIGHANDVRIATRKVLKPLSFVLFVLRQQYLDAWMCLLRVSENSRLLRNVRTSLEDVNAAFHSDLDDCEMMLA